MPQGLPEMHVALRVLTAVTEKRRPDAGDVAELRGLAPLLADQPLDDLARHIIEEALKKQRKSPQPKCA